MTNRMVRAAALSAAILIPATASAQRMQPVNARAAVPATANGNAREWMAELQRIQGRLQQVHNQVMQDAGLRSSQEAFMRDVKAAMLRVDPGLDALAQRVQAMQQQATGAQQRRDLRTLQQLNTDLTPIQQRFMRAQQQVLQQPAFAARARTIETRLHQRMLQVEPDTDHLLERGRDLQALLIRLQQQQLQAGPRN